MRPTRLVVSGFTAFRNETQLDFTGADLFAFSGPTGSGKSSLVDAMVFALYGCVPRLDRRAVAPVISLGRNEARVQLDFTVGGEAYTAVRVVRRTKTGASTREARLERADGEVLAGNEKELTAEVERLLGLGFDHFTTCVVLPQGEFARFLHAADKERQDLLVSLLDFGLYRRMARLANERGQSARRDAAVASAVLETLAFATPEALVAAEGRVMQLTTLRSAVDAVAPKLDALLRQEEEGLTDARRARSEVELLAGVTAPADVGALVQMRAEAQAALADADTEADRASVAADEAEKALAVRPPRTALERVLHAHAERTTLLADQARGERALDQQISEVAQLSAALSTAEEAAADATTRLELVLWEHRAHDLAASLVAGEACPVCRQPVLVVPSSADDATSVDEVRAEKKRADTSLAAARRDHEAADRLRAEIIMKLETIAGKLAGSADLLAEHPDREPVAAALVELDAAEKQEQAARQASRSADRAVVAARKAVEHHDRAEVAARRGYDEVRDQVAALRPPAADRVDLAADWAALVSWAGAERPARVAAAEAATTRADAAVRERSELQQGLAERCQDAGIDVAGTRDVRSTVADALAGASAQRARIEQGLADVATRRDEVSEHTRRADVASELARLLSVRHFEKWVLDETLAGLVAGATSLLCELSGGAYSLALDERSAFNVVDHRNADEVRSARTLSGGETFLASLALALALADQIGSLAAGGSARLESIFLDEGFGTLDPDTLDTVASAIEELGARGRTVGLISHVPELAERVPVRFEVSKGPGGASVTRVVT
jgi:exonuclease SbcC